MARIKSTNVLSFFKEQITLLESSNKLGTARNYRRTLSSFSLFLEGRVFLSGCSMSRWLSGMKAGSG